MGDRCASNKMALPASATASRSSTPPWASCSSQPSNATRRHRATAGAPTWRASWPKTPLVGLRGLAASEPWTRLLAEVRALRLETEFLENARLMVAHGFLAAVEAEKKKA